MYGLVSLCFFLALVTLVQGEEQPFPALGDPHSSDESFRLVWKEEFSGTKLDRKKWVAEDDSAIGQYGHGNGESQAYLDAEGDTFFVKDGKLTIVARHAPDAQYPLREKPYGKLKHNIGQQDFKSAKLIYGEASLLYLRDL